MQFMVQGAWGVVPVHLNELSPEGIRATFPGFVYQLGNLLASYNATLQTTIAENHGSVAQPDFSFAFVVVVGTVAALLVVLASFGPERRDVRFGLQ
jgi:SHS family lactate transporter-like MFS transporter